MAHDTHYLVMTHEHMAHAGAADVGVCGGQKQQLTQLPSLSCALLSLTTKLKKPTWLFEMPCLLRSKSGLMGMPAAASLSPCWKYSSSSRATHLQAGGTQQGRN